MYAGSLGYSYDLTSVFSAIREIERKQRNRLKFLIIGDGPKRAQFEEESTGLPVCFTGFLPYGEMVWLLSRCDIAINPLNKNAAQSIINKHMDYAMAGLPVINTQECIEYRNLLEKYRCGINCECENVSDIGNAIGKLCGDSELRTRMGENHRRMAEKIFNRRKSYRRITEIFDQNL